jgi:rfaE bifunctional protein kinase chain/domain
MKNVFLAEEQLLRILAGFKKLNVAVLGDIGIDRYTEGTTERISPEAPVPIVFVRSEFLKLGLAANVADNIIALGGRAQLSGVIGRDQDGKDLVRLLQQKKLPTSALVSDSSRRTILKERIVSESQQMLRVDYENTHALSKEIQTKMKAAVLKCIAKADALIIEDYAKGLLCKPLMKTAIQAAKAKKIPILVDPHLKTPADWYSGATLLTPNKREAEALAGEKILDEKSLVRVGQKIIKMTGAKSLVITLGKEGMAIFKDAKASPVHIPTFAQEVYDVSGAGDTVISVLALAMAAGAKLDEAAFISNLAAGVEVSKRGTATVSQQEIMLAYGINGIS